MNKTIETTKALSKALVLSVLTIFALATASFGDMKPFNPSITADLNGKLHYTKKFDPIGYEMDLIVEDKKLQETMQKNLQECKIRAARGKQYRAYIDAHPELNSKYTKTVVTACQARVAAVCGALMSASKE